MDTDGIDYRYIGQAAHGLESLNKRYDVLLSYLLGMVEEHCYERGKREVVTNEKAPQPVKATGRR